MAFRNFSSKQYTLDRDVVTIFAAARTNGSGAFTNQRGLGATLARSDVGLATLTLDAGLKFDSILHVSAVLRTPGATAVDAFVQVGTWVATGVGVLTLKCIQNDATETVAVQEWPAADVDSELMVAVTFRNTNQKPSN